MGGLLAGEKRETAARFSFLLSMPAITASGLLELRKALKILPPESFTPLIVATAVSAVVGYVSIWALLAYLFRLDGSQTMACVMCIGILSMITKLFLVGAMLSALGASMGSSDNDTIDQGQSIQVNQ